MKRVVTLVLIFLFLLASAILWMAGGVQSERAYASEPVTFSDVEAAPGEARTATGSRALSVLVWNIAWGYGWGSEGTGKARPKEHFEHSIQNIGERVKATKADIVLLQEVDFGATRSGGVDQLHAIARYAGLPHAAYAPSWEANWIPFPYWPIREHFGRMRSGGAILSRFPIRASDVRLFPKPVEQPWWYNLFYLFRYLQHAEVDLDGRRLAVYNAHLEAFGLETRVKEATVVRGILERNENPRLIFGGDMNAVPPEATRKSDYPDETKVKTSHLGDSTIETLRGTPRLSDSVPRERYLEDEAAYFTFPSHEPNRMLDHLFYGPGLELIDVRVVHEAGDVSDHLPLLVRVRLKDAT